MEVVESEQKLLCNLEVLSYLQEIKKRDQHLFKHQTNLSTITYETVNYLEGTAGQQLQQMKPEQVQQLLHELKQYRLTKIEKLQIVNQRPSTLIELQLLIEENEERFTETALEQILAIVQRTTGNHQADDVAEQQQSELLLPAEQQDADDDE